MAHCHNQTLHLDVCIFKVLMMIFWSSSKQSWKNAGLKRNCMSRRLWCIFIVGIYPLSARNFQKHDWGVLNSPISKIPFGHKFLALSSKNENATMESLTKINNDLVEDSSINFIVCLPIIILYSEIKSNGIYLYMSSLSGNAHQISRKLDKIMGDN